MPSNTNNSAPQSPEFAPPSPAYARKSFFGDNSQKHINQFHNQEYYEKFKDQITSFVSKEQEKGTANDVVTTRIHEHINQKIIQLREFMTKRGNSPEKIEEAVESEYQQLRQIVEEIMKDRCLQGLKNECEAIIAEEQEKETAPEHIKKQVKEIINNKLHALYKFHKTAGHTNEVANQKITNLHPVIKDLIRPLLTKIQESKQENCEDAQFTVSFIRDAKNGYEEIISRKLDDGMLAGEIAIFIRENMKELLGIKRQYITDLEIPPQEIEEAVRVFNLELKEAVAPLLKKLEKLQEENTEFDLDAMRSLQISNISSPTGGTSPSPASSASTNHSSSPDIPPSLPRLG